MSFPLYLDEHVDIQLAVLLGRLNHDVLKTLDVGRAGKGIADEDQLAFATSQGRAILTYDVKDYLDIASVWAADGCHHAGVILTRRRFPADLVRGVLRLFASHPEGIGDIALWLEIPKVS